MIVYAGSEVGPDELPVEFLEPAGSGRKLRVGEMPEGDIDFKAARAEFEARFLERKLKEYRGNVSRLAEAIGLERSYLYRKLKSCNIQVAD